MVYENPCSKDDFNPLPPCGGRRVAEEQRERLWMISIHSLRVEGDREIVVNAQKQTTFQSTPSVWRETPADNEIIRLRNISIHSLRVEGDKMPPVLCHHRRHFNPLPPCGGRRDVRKL